jgi:hypothetical protein
MDPFTLTSTTYLPHFDIDLLADDWLVQYRHNPKYVLVVTDIVKIFTVFSMEFQYGVANPIRCITKATIVMIYPANKVGFAALQTPIAITIYYFVEILFAN